MNNKYDVIIIGAGLGGLTAGSILSQKGKKILILEKNNVPGGYAVNFIRKGREFDASLHLTNNLEKKENINYSITEICGIKNAVKLLSPTYLFRSIFPDYDITFPQCKSNEYFNILKKLFPKEKAGIYKLKESIEGIFYTMEAIETHKITKRQFIEYLNSPFDQILNKYIKNKRLSAVMSQLWLYHSLPPKYLSATYYSYSFYDYVHNGGYYPKGGSQGLTNALVSAFRKNGGELKLNSKVNRIITKNDAVEGVCTEQKDHFFATTIISNIDSIKTFTYLINEKKIKDATLNKLRKLKPSLSAFQVYLGLNTDIKKNGFFDHEVFVNPNYNLTKQYNSFLNNKINEVPFIITVNSNIPGNVNYNGLSNVSLYTLANYKYWASLSKTNYHIQKNKLAELLIKKAEKIIPNLSSNIDVLEAATPITMERYTDSYKGAIFGWASMVSQSGIERPKPSTPVKNLHLVGAWTRPGGGVKSVIRSGIYLANKILKIS